MFARPGLTLIEIVSSLGLTALLFGFSMAPALYVYKQLVVSEDRNAVELLGSQIRNVSVRVFHPGLLRLELHGPTLLLIGNTQIPILDVSSCGPLMIEYKYATPESGISVACDRHTMELNASGKIHIEADTL